ncbi:hypothetical protein [Kalamiella sp. sgz302252]|uniref:hypothetical protein n=1 Tax=Pantoea sp. sgz302252 TaxID=3341827 RepID=UPI0036D31BCE
MYELTECELKKVAGGVGNQYFFTPVSIPDFFLSKYKKCVIRQSQPLCYNAHMARSRPACFVAFFQDMIATAQARLNKRLLDSEKAKRQSICYKAASAEVLALCLPVTKA